MAEVDVKNKFAVGDKIEMILPGGNRDITVEAMFDKYGNPLQEALGGGYEVRIPVPDTAMAYGLLARYF